VLARQRRFAAGRPKAVLSFRSPQRCARKGGGLRIAFRPSHPSFPIVITIFMPPIIAQACCTKKPTVGFQARFILEGPGRRWRLSHNGLRRKKSQKTGKKQKKV